MSIIAALAALVLAAPLFSHAVFLRENARAGQLARVRQLCGGRLALPLLRSALHSAWSLALALAAYPLGWLPQARPRPQPPGGPPAVLLVHGLYHNASAWLLFRPRLAQAGFADVRTHAYSSFFRPFGSIVVGVARAARQAADESPTGTVLLVGHSLGGLLVRAVCAQADLRGRVAGVATLGAPHRGSVLAGLLAVGRLGRGLALGGEVSRLVRGLPVCSAPALSLYSPTDSMVLPLSGSLLEEREKGAGWREDCLPPVSHMGLVYSREAAGRCVAFLLAAAGRG